MRPLAVFGIASAASMVAGVQLVLGIGGAHGSDGTELGVGLGYEYDLGRLQLLDKTLYHVEESYVEPGRIDWEEMYVAALEAVERQVPSAMFTREPGGQLLSVEIGEVRDVLEVAPITSRKQLSEELKRVAAMLDRHLAAEDVPAGDPQIEPFAEIEYTMINGLLSTLDPHSVLLPPPDATEMDLENQGEFGGLGITIVERENRLTIEYPMDDSPAMRAGLKADDRIVRIDGESTINMSLDEAVRLLRGPIGAAVELEVEREGAREPVAFTIVRDKIPLHAVEGHLLSGDVGYVRIESFHQAVERQLVDVLAKLHRDSATGRLRGLVIDLRENPGGYLNQAIKVADIFLDRGTIVSTVDGSGQKHDEELATPGTEPLYPIAVLVDARSASASEIVAGALRNNERAVIVGERTFGKGSVQNLHALYDDSKLKITISKYLTPHDQSIQSVGIPADIELRPNIVAKKGDGETGPLQDVAAVFHRERVPREADLDKHLDQVALHIEEPAYVLPYLRPWADRRPSRTQPEADQEVAFARDVLLAAPSWRRAEILAAAAPVVQRAATQQEKGIAQAFAGLGVDWTRGAAFPRDRAAATPPLTVKLDLGDDGVLTAGEREQVAVEVTNTTDTTLYQVAAVAIENDVLEGKEFFFGKLAPGETKRWAHEVTLTDGYPSERMPLTLEIRDAAPEPLMTHDTDLTVAGRPLPRLEWSWTMSDAAGDGDGVAEIGERIEIAMTVRNVGNGPTANAFARLKNKAGRALDLIRGNVAPGYVVDAAGEACRAEAPGNDAGTIVGDPRHERVLAGKEPLWPTGCVRILEPGQSWTGSFLVELREEPKNGKYAVELALGDQDAYDFASVMRSGFYAHFTQQETIAFSAGVALPEGPTRRPPAIQVTRAPAITVDSRRATVSGLVEDDSGIAHVMVFAGNDKVFFQGSGRSSTLRSIPFTADVTLEPGPNTISIVTTDVDGFTQTSSVVTYNADSEVARAPRE